MNMKKIISNALTTLCFFTFAHAEVKSEADNHQQQVVAAPTLVVPQQTMKLSVNASSSYFDLKGHKADDRNYYDFDKLSVRADLLNVNCGYQGGWSANLLMQHHEIYTESIFPQAVLPEWKRSTDRTQGAGDTFFTFVAPMQFLGQWMVIPDFGISIPTGGINHKSHLSGLEKSNLAYNAQHGSGTYDVLVGGTAIWANASGVLFGNRAFAQIRTGKNSNDYSLGNLYRLDSWLDYNTQYVTPRLVGYYRHKNPIRGFDKTRGYELLAVTYENAADEFYHHDQKDWSVSAALKSSTAILKTGINLTAEVGVPLAQGNMNWDNSEVITQYFGSIGLSGQW